MNKLYSQLMWTIVLSMLVFSISFGGGYQLNEQGARATGMGGAFVARASDPSAIYFNPAGLTQLQGINVLGGINLIMPSTTFKGAHIMKPEETSTSSQVFTPINLYGTYQIDDKFTVGLGIYNPFGLGTEWPEQWGKKNTDNLFLGSTKAIKSEIQTFYFNPSVAYKINDEISVGLGLSYVYGTVFMSKNLSSTSIKKLEMEGTGSGFNVNFGAMYKVMDELSVGLSYRMTTEIEFSGDLKIAGVKSAEGKAKLPMPGTLLVGAAYNVLPELTIEGNVQYTQWSAYKDLTINFNIPVNSLGNIKSIYENKDWYDATMLRLGAEYEMNKQLTLRGGFIYDFTPQPRYTTEPMLPDADRFDVTLGGSYKINEKLYVDVSYMLVLFSEKDATNSALPGFYNSNAHIISLNFGYSF